ncbi:MAG: transposase [Thermodesulfobacteriota bacterium]
MPRKARIDAPGALHHIIIRGIEKKAIFRDDQDRDNLLHRLGNVLSETSTQCYAWALIPNHVHLLLSTGLVPIATVMRRVLTGYAQQFNRRHRRHGQLFQNRYKSILCQEDPYLLELVRYIHLNPLRAKIVSDMGELDGYPYSGHSVILGKRKNSWQNTGYVLGYFGQKLISARRRYGAFIEAGVNMGRRPELTGGGLIRSLGGWSALKSLRSKQIRVKADERILGDSGFVQEALEKANEHFERRTLLKSQGMDMRKLLSRVADHYGVDGEDLKMRSKAQGLARPRAVFCYLATRELGESCASVARSLHITPSAVSKAAVRGQALVHEQNLQNKLLES